MKFDRQQRLPDSSLNDRLKVIELRRKDKYGMLFSQALDDLPDQEQALRLSTAERVDQQNRRMQAEIWTSARKEYFQASAQDKTEILNRWKTWPGPHTAENFAWLVSVTLYDIMVAQNTTVISTDDLQAALIRCMEAEPPKNYVLSVDSSSLTDILQELRYHGLTGCKFADFPLKSREAYRRWGESAKEASNISTAVLA